MHIGIDVSSVIYGTGVSRYTANLVRAMAALPNDELKLSLFGTSLRSHDKLRHFVRSLDQAHIDSTLWYLPPNLLAYIVAKGWVAAPRLGSGAGLFHAWDWYLPRSGGSKTVMTVHDLALFRDDAQSAHPQIRDRHLKVLERGISQQTHVIAVSEATKLDLIELFSYPENLIRVIPEALPEEQRLVVSAERADELVSRAVGTRPYMLIVGTQEPRKNIPAMVEAWSAYKDEYDLVLVGKSGWERLDVQEGMHLLGYVEGEMLAALYLRASVFLYCSLYEGFGLPILEAFFHNTPVVTSNTSSMPEVAGQAAVLVDPGSRESIVLGIERALNQSTELVEAGTKQLASYMDWNEVAKATVAYYKEIVEPS